MTTPLLEKLVSSGALTEQEMGAVFSDMLTGKLDPAVIAAYLTAWRAKGEDATLLSIGARAMRSAAQSVQLSKTLRPLADNCGTGGDGASSFNVSTAAAIVAAAGGARIAKHGNRSVSSKCGSADLLFAAGLPDKLSEGAHALLLQEFGFTFFFAPNFHPAMRHVGPVRKALGIRTVFNLLGPLANPIAPEVQLLGVGARPYVEPMARALSELGIKRALVVHSQDGLDEISPAAKTDAILVESAKLTSTTIDPKDYGIRAKLDDLRGGDPAQNLALLTKLLSGERGGIFDAVTLNAGALLWLTGVADSIASGVEKAGRVIRDGTSKRHFANWIERAKAWPTSPTS